MPGLIVAGLRDCSIERLGEERAAELWADRRFEITHSYDDEWFAAQLEPLAAATRESRAQVEHGFCVFAARTTFRRPLSRVLRAECRRLRVPPRDRGEDRQLCRLLAGLVAGTAEQLDQEVDVEEIQCMLRGDPGCVFTVVASKRG